MPSKRLPQHFYLNPDVVQVSKQLLGKILVSNIGAKVCRARIVETEAYRAPEDKASHAYENKRTNRTQVMFERGGHVYVYLCYGVHHLFNVVTGPEEAAHAVLLRGLEPIDGLETMLERRGMNIAKPQLTAGPGVLTKAMGITKEHNGIDLTKKNSPIWIEDAIDCPQDAILASPRVGVDYAEECTSWPWRFRIKESKWTSPAK